MKDTSEFQDANEQARPAQTRTKSAPRSKTDTSATSSQGTATPRRRTDSQGSHRTPNGQERANTASASNTATRPAPHRQSSSSGNTQRNVGNDEHRPNNSTRVSGSDT